MYLTCFKDSLPILSDSYQVIFASKLSYRCWHKPLPYDGGRRLIHNPRATARIKRTAGRRSASPQIQEQIGALLPHGAGGEGGDLDLQVVIVVANSVDKASPLGKLN